MKRFVTTIFVFALAAMTSIAADVDSLLSRIQAVGKEGAGNADAGKAWAELVKQGPDALLPTLRAFNKADATAANWLRAAVDAVAERQLAEGKPLPAAQLEAFVMQTNHAGPARRLAYEWLVRVDPKAPDRFLSNLLQDPSVELRRDAVARAMSDAKQLLDKGDKPAAAAAYQKALAGARDRDQVDQIAKQLGSLGVSVDLAAHFGFIRTWQLAGPFEHAGGVGFAAVYPPERGVELQKTYRGKKEAELRWIVHATSDPYGLVDLNKALSKHMGAVAYAFAAVESPTERPVEIRVGSNNAVKIFLNGKPLFAREEYHHGSRMDQHVGRGTLHAGRNEILLKVCQNEQKDDWAQSWSFQLRLCDAVGTAVPFTVAK